MTKQTPPVSLSSRQVKEADRVGGIELMLLYPAELGPDPILETDHDREASPSEKQMAEHLVASACRQAGLVPVHVRVACVRRPKPPPLLPRPDEYVAHLAVVIIGQRWVHASTDRQPRVMWAAA